MTHTPDHRADDPLCRPPALGFRILGPLTIADGTDEVILQPSKPTSLLATLLLHPNRVVSTDHLRQSIWGERQPSSANAALHTCIQRLRRVFARHGIADHTIEYVPGGYRIAAVPESLDLLRFRSLVRTAQGRNASLAETGLLREALSLWRGPLLANVPSDALHRDEVSQLMEERLSVVERLADLELSAGRCLEVMPDLRSVIRSHPGRERFWEQLIEALHRSGRQVDALAEYRRVKDYLRDELGVYPGARLQRLEMAILRGHDLGSPALSRHPPTALSADPAPGRSRRSPSLPLVPFFRGREAESSAIARELTDTQSEPALVVLSGAPGIGKTALALHTAHQVRESFPSGRVLLRMSRDDGAPLTAAEAAHAWQEALAGTTGPRHPTGGEAHEPLPPVPAGMLLLLDEVVRTEQVLPFLPTEPGSAVVVTTRLRLAGLAAGHGCRVHRLGTLAPEDSFALVTAMLGRARAEREPEAVRALSEVCGHYPLALRIAAAFLLTRPELTVEEGADWLRQDPVSRLSLLDDAELSVRQVFGGALARVDRWFAEQFLLIAQSARQPFSAGDCASALGVADRTAGAVLEHLAEAGLLEGGPRHYTMHGLLRAFACHPDAVGPPEARDVFPAGSDSGPTSAWPVHPRRP
ncbi:BTAD domain-containing putative transcriptional regulator [Streptomyces rubiginosohelvolus]|uniref:AfsR/SARP family transcriptional regulator n=1 Tax=Streptomyces rubiginosohelvolus TaxID=67362 RepID=UPI003431EF0F